MTLLASECDLLVSAADSPVKPALPASVDGLAVNDNDVVRFPQGLPGFERCQHFIVLDSPDLAPLRCLRAVSGPPATFMAIDPNLVVPGYAVQMSENTLARLGANQDDPLLWLAIVAVGSDGTATVNLRAPIAINPSQMVGCQVVADAGAYPLRHPLGRN